MSMFMASMRQAAKDGELDSMGMFGAALKQEVAEYERRLAEDSERRKLFPSEPADAQKAEG